MIAEAPKTTMKIQTFKFGFLLEKLCENFIIYKPQTWYLNMRVNKNNAAILSQKSDAKYHLKKKTE